MRIRLLFAPLAILAVVACDRTLPGSAAPVASSIPGPPDPPPTPTVAVSASASAAPSADAAPPKEHANPPPLPDADIATLEKGLKCTPGSLPKAAGPCKVLVTMEKCADWTVVVPSGDARWIGHGWRTAGAKTANEVTILRLHAVPQTDVKPWQLPAKISLGAIGKDAGPALAQADLAIGAFARHAAAPAKNAAVDFLKQKADWTDDAAAAKTMGSMVETFSDHPTYLCQGPAHQIELVQQASADIGLKSDGLYAELWPATP